ncbi:MAG: Gfo/Idh/MocA family oxidoreductase, partial [Candidatus Latescibacterota bacterium]|nr:Gfo/Idh/MocA family oxidoreductase [Candidatus Latescibacterota bacterium]
EQLDLISVCTTARMRCAIINDVAQSRVRGIWAEKPIALSVDEADAIVDVCRRNSVAVAVNCARRWNPHFETARGLIDDGELGEVLQVTAYAQCGLSHNGSHAIDTIRYLAGGDVSWVFGEMESDEAAEGENDLQGNGYLAFDNGVRAYLRALPTGIASWEFDVVGTEGRIRSLAGATEWELWKTAPGGPRGRGVPARLPYPMPARIPGMGITIVEDLISAVEGGPAPRCSAEDGRAALEIAIALRESHRRGGERVNLPAEDRSLRILSSEIREDSEPARIRRLHASG